MAETQTKFGSCCAELKEAIDSDEFEPLISEDDDDGILYMAVGLMDMEDDEPGMVDHPVFFCPFCGTQVQDPVAVKAMLDAQANNGGVES